MIQDKIFFDEKDPTGLNYNTPFTFYGSYEGRLWSKAPGGEIKYYTQNSDLSVFATTGSNQFNGSQSITGSLSVTGTITGTVAGTTATASYVEYTNVANKPALISGSAQIASFGIFATTGSNGFNGSQSITGSLTVTGQVVAQTLNVQQVTSSVVFSSGSNIFGNSLANTQQFTGSVSITGSLNTSITAFGSAAAVFLTSDGGTIRSRTAAQTLTDIAALPLAGGTLTGPLTGSSAVFSGNLKIIAPVTGTNKLTFGVTGTDYYTLEYNDNTGNINYQSKYSHIFSGGAAGTTTILTLANTGAATFTGTTGNRVTLYNSGNNSGINGLLIDSDIYPGITFNSRSSASGAVIGGGKLVYNAVATGYGAASLGGAILLQADNALQFSTGGDNVRVTISSGGNLLIGTSTDAGANQPLQVIKTGSSNYLRIQTDNNASYDCGHFFTDGTNSVYAGMLRATSGLTGAHTIYTGGSSRLNVTSDGYVRLTSSSGGIQFNGDTAAANALDDYEEGSFTPSSLVTNFSSISVTFGRYIKIGNQVTINCRWSVTPGSTGMKYLAFDLPFAFANNNSVSFTGAVSNYNEGLTAGSSNVGTTVRNSSGSTTQQYVEAYYTSTNVSSLQLSMTYFTFF